MIRINKIVAVLIVVFFVTGLSAQNLKVTEKFADGKNRYSLLYVKGFKIKKTKTGTEITSKDKALAVTVKVHDSKELEAIGKKASKTSADTLDVLQSIISSQGVTKELDSSMTVMPQEYISNAKAEAGSLTKYDLKKKNARFVCRSMVFKKGDKIISLNYSIAEKKGNEKYEKPADDILRSFAFME
jgi:hypothetical protein